MQKSILLAFSPVKKAGSSIIYYYLLLSYNKYYIWIVSNRKDAFAKISIINLLIIKFTKIMIYINYKNETISP